MRPLDGRPPSGREERLRLFRGSSLPPPPVGGGGSTFLLPLEEESAAPSPASHTKRRLGAILLAALSGLAFTYCALSVRLLRRLSPPEVLLFRTGMQCLLTAPTVAWCLRRAAGEGPGAPWRWVVGQGVVMAFSLQLLFVAFQRLPLGDASALVFSSPAYVSVLAWVLLGERPGATECLAILGVVVGGVLVCHAGGDAVGDEVVSTTRRLDAAGLASAAVGTLGYSLHLVLIRRLRGVHWSLTTLSLSAQTFLLSGAVLLVTGTFKIPVDQFEWTLVSTVGLAGTAAHALLAVALSMEEAAVVSATRSLDIAVAYVVQVSVCRESPAPVALGGAVLVTACVLLVALGPCLAPKLHLCLLGVRDCFERVRRRS